MAFRLGNFNIDEIIYGIAENFEGEVLYTLDQLSSASIEISSESTDITDKKGNIVRTIYRSKTGTFTATNAFLHPQIMAAGTGSAIENATSSDKLVMPKVLVVSAGTTETLSDIVADTVPEVIGLFGAGANSNRLEKAAGTSASFSGNDGEFVWNAGDLSVTVPAEATDAPINYLIKYDREVESGIKISNTADKFPATVALTLYCSYVDPCDDELKACYVVLPSFQASPETTISLDAENQEMDFNGSIQVDYCATSPVLYYIYLPEETAVKTGV